jgi:hypothetical protein
MYRDLYDHSFFAAKAIAPKIPVAAQPAEGTEASETKDPQ